MRILALDLSKRSTGWACYADGDSGPSYGHWVLGSEFTSDGRTYCKLHENMTDLHSLGPIDAVYFEEPLHPAKLQGHTNITSLRVLAGLAAHAQSWGEAMQCRHIHAVNMSSWRKDFIGSQKRGTKRHTLKSLSLERCRQLGFNPRNDDEADALGILDHACVCLDIMPNWRRAEVLRPPLGMPS